MCSPQSECFSADCLSCASLWEKRHRARFVPGICLPRPSGSNAEPRLRMRLRADRSVSFSDLAQTDRGGYISVTGGRSALQASLLLVEQGALGDQRRSFTALLCECKKLATYSIVRTAKT